MWRSRKPRVGSLAGHNGDTAIRPPRTRSKNSSGVNVTPAVPSAHGRLRSDAWKAR
ncbi:MAG: hypothetical protein ACJARS_001722 [bacterium]|jgi:hypothetical protein